MSVATAPTAPFVSTDISEPSAHGLKDYLIFRVDERDGQRELAGDSTLEEEAARYADLVAATEPEAGIHYEVRAVDTDRLLHTTEGHTRREEEAWLQTAML